MTVTVLFYKALQYSMQINGLYVGEYFQRFILDRTHFLIEVANTIIVAYGIK